MTSPVVTETPRRLEPAGPDPFLEDAPAASPPPVVAASAPAPQRRRILD